MLRILSLLVGVALATPAFAEPIESFDQFLRNFEAEGPGCRGDRGDLRNGDGRA